MNAHHSNNAEVPQDHSDSDVVDDSVVGAEHLGEIQVSKEKKQEERGQDEPTVNKFVAPWNIATDDPNDCLAILCATTNFSRKPTGVHYGCCCDSPPPSGRAKIHANLGEKWQVNLKSSYFLLFSRSDFRLSFLLLLFTSHELFTSTTSANIEDHKKREPFIRTAGHTFHCFDFAPNVCYEKKLTYTCKEELEILSWRRSLLTWWENWQLTATQQLPFPRFRCGTECTLSIHRLTDPCNKTLTWNHMKGVLSTRR